MGQIRMIISIFYNLKFFHFINNYILFPIYLDIEFQKIKEFAQNHMVNKKLQKQV